MGNCAPMKPSGRLVHPDGRVQHFSESQSVAQVMMNNPEYYIGLQRSARSILAGDEFVQPGQLYYFLPSHLIPPEMFQWRKTREEVQSREHHSRSDMKAEYVLKRPASRSMRGQRDIKSGHVLKMPSSRSVKAR